jgi:hypothetical protein
MALPVWTVSYCGWSNEGQSQGQVKVTVLHWRATLDEGEFHAEQYGSTPDDQNRIYTLAGLEAVPEAVMVGWAQQALGQEEVDRIEAALAADIAEQQNPTTGGVSPGA